MMVGRRGIERAANDAEDCVGKVVGRIIWSEDDVDAVRKADDGSSIAARRDARTIGIMVEKVYGEKYNTVRK